MTERVQVIIDTELCVGSTMCVGFAPGALELNDEGRPVPLSSSLELTLELRDAIDGCPVQAIGTRSAD